MFRPKKSLLYYTLYLIISVMLICGYVQAEPKWYKSGEHDYSKKKFLIGYGKGFSYEQASTESFIDIASQLEITVSSKLNYTAVEKSNKKKFSFSRKSKTDINSIVQESIQGAEVVQRESKDGLFYVLTVLKKKSLIKQLKGQLKKTDKTLVDTYNVALKAFDSGNLNLGFNHYRKIQSFLPVFNTKKTIYEILSEKSFSNRFKQSNYDLTKEISLILKDVSLEVINGDKQKARAGQSLQPIQYGVFYKKDTKKHPLESIKVGFEYADGTTLGSAYTNQNGAVSVIPIAIPIKRKQTKIIATILWPELDYEWLQFIENTRMSSSYSLKEPLQAIPLSFITQDDKGESMPDLFSKLKSQLEEIGFSFSDNSNLTLTATFSANNPKTLKTPSETLHMLSVNLNFSLKKNTNELGSLSLQISSIGNSAEDSLVKSYQLFNIDRLAFWELYSNVYNK